MAGAAGRWVAGGRQSAQESSLQRAVCNLFSPVFLQNMFTVLVTLPTLQVRPGALHRLCCMYRQTSLRLHNTAAHQPP
jgi:hypothetical protein